MNMHEIQHQWHRFLSWLRGLPKPVALMVIGVIGGLAGATIGEIYLAGSRDDRGSPTRVQVTADIPSSGTGADVVCLLLDTSMSMSDGKLDEVVQAAKHFATTHSGQIAMVRFSSEAEILCEPTIVPNEIIHALGQLASDGSTNMAAGLDTAGKVLEGVSQSPAVLLFTDGMPNDKNAAIESASILREKGISIVAIGTKDANVEILEQITGDPSLVVETEQGEFAVAFNEAQSLLSGQLIEPDAKYRVSFWHTLWRVGVWTILISMIATLALVIGQHHLQRRPLPKPEDLAMIAARAAFAGGAAGLVGQLAFIVLDLTPLATSISHILGWTILGCLLGSGIVRVAPNVDQKRAAVAGAVGGSVGAILFLLISSILGAFLGRLMGVIALVGSLGIAMGLVEVLFRRAWLVVDYGQNETNTVNLGSEPVTVGGGDEDTVYVGGLAPSLVRFILEDGRVLWQHGNSAPVAAQPGEKMRVGGVKFTVRGDRILRDDD